MTRYSDLAVLTGDIVKSTDIAPEALDAAFEQMAQTVRVLPFDAYFARFRGDGWQVAIPQLETAPLVLTFIWADLRHCGLLTRVSAAVGDGLIADGDLASASGTAFERSGRGLEHMGNKTLFLDPSCPLAWLSGLPLLDFIARNWTSKQAEIVKMALSQGTKLNVSGLSRNAQLARQTVAQHLDAAGFFAVQSMLEAFWSGEPDK